MNISAAFIRRPIATALLMAAILLLGLISYELLPVAALPNIDTPTVMVTAQLPGADAQTVASTVTTPLERQFGQIPGLTQMTSSSGNESSTMTLQFDRAASVDFASQAVQAAINAAAGFLPPMPTPPIYRLTNPADTPVLMLALTSETLPLTTVSDYANSILVQKISQMPGVGLVSIGGAQNPSIRVQVNPALLAAMGLDLEAVRTALATATVDQPKGTLYGANEAFALQTNDQLMTAEGFNKHALREHDTPDHDHLDLAFGRAWCIAHAYRPAHADHIGVGVDRGRRREQHADPDPRRTGRRLHHCRRLPRMPTSRTREYFQTFPTL
jgi:multidrug efflux pump subunit AcrB